MFLLMHKIKQKKEEREGGRLKVEHSRSILKGGEGLFANILSKRIIFIVINIGEIVYSQLYWNLLNLNLKKMVRPILNLLQNCYLRVRFEQLKRRVGSI